MDPLHTPLPSLQPLIKYRYQRLRQPKAKDQLRPRHEQFRRQALKEARKPLVLRHITQDSEAALWVVEISVLDPRFYDVEGSGDDEGGGGAGDGGDEVLAPGGGVVVFEFVPPLLGGCGTTEEL